MKELGNLYHFVFAQESIDIWLFANQIRSATITNVCLTYLPKDFNSVINLISE